jgi:hypothetical protein
LLNFSLAIRAAKRNKKPKEKIYFSPIKRLKTKTDYNQSAISNILRVYSFVYWTPREFLHLKFQLSSFLGMVTPNFVQGNSVQCFEIAQKSIFFKRTHVKLQSYLQINVLWPPNFSMNSSQEGAKRKLAEISGPFFCIIQTPKMLSK